MRIFILELKRLVKTRAVWISIAIGVILSIALSFSTISSNEYEYAGKNNSMEKITGISAIKANKKQAKPFEGEVTVEDLQSDLEVFHSLVKQYGNDIPYNLFCKEIIPRWMHLNLITSVYSGDDSNIFEGLKNVYPNDITNIYSNRNEVLKNKLLVKYPNNVAAQSKALTQNASVKTPFIYKGGIQSTRGFTDIDFLSLILAILCIFMNSPIFSGEYQTGSDDILRCTKYGRGRLGLSKICASVLIDFILFVICISTYLIIIEHAYGMESLKSSIQMFMPFSILPMTIGQAGEFVILAGFINVFAVLCFTMFLSSVSSNSTTTLIIAIAIFIFPDIFLQLHTGMGI